jgi:microcin C transport system substrate-binding protein
MWLDYNSLSAEISGLLFEPLVQMDPLKNEPVGVLAESWEISEDGKSFTFHIDPRARWSDGKAISAADIQFYYDVLMNPKHMTSIFRVGLKRLKRPEVIDSLTLRVVAESDHWQNFWEAAGLVAFPRQVWEGKDFNKERFDFPVVSGPYKLGTLKKDRFVSLFARDDWWGRQKKSNAGQYNFSELKYRFINDRNKALEALKKGDLDILPIYTSSIWMKQTDFDAVQKGWVVRQKIVNSEPVGFQGMAINMRRERFQDVRVRKALELLLDRKTINKQYMYNQYFLLNSYYPDLYPNKQNPKIPVVEFNPDKARALLKEAGWLVNEQGKLAKDGKEFSLSFITSMEDRRHLTRYQEDLQAVGFTVNIEKMSMATVRKRLEKYDYDMYWTAWGAGRLRDPEGQWHSSTADQMAGSNLPGVKDAVVDSLIEAQKHEASLDKRNEILRQIDKRLMETIPYVLLWQAGHHRILYWNQFGMPKTVFDKYNREDSAIRYWWFDAGKQAALENARANDTRMAQQPPVVNWQPVVGPFVHKKTAPADSAAQK